MHGQGFCQLAESAILAESEIFKAFSGGLAQASPPDGVADRMAGP